MATPTINIGLGSKGKALMLSIDEHFRLHEAPLYDSILSSSVIYDNGKYHFEVLDKKGESDTCDSENIRVWLDNKLYPGINNLKVVSSGGAGYVTIINIILQIEGVDLTVVLKDLLSSIQGLKDEQLVGVISVRLFVDIEPSNKKNSNSNKEIEGHLFALKELIEEFDILLHDIYYIDNQNVDRIHLNMNPKWLGFALAEFCVLQMVGPSSLAKTNKNKVFGLGVVHFNEVLFRELVSDKILAFKFDEEKIGESSGVQQQDIFDRCNPFIKSHQNFFQRFFEKYPYSSDNENKIEKNSKRYILEFKKNLNDFVRDKQVTIGESKAVLANLIGEDDEKLEGVDWKSERLYLKDLEFDIVNYFNDFVHEEDKVDLHKEKELRERITDLKNGIKKDKRLLKKIDEKSQNIHSNLNISFEEGIFSIDGKRINASGYIPSKIDPNEKYYEFRDTVIPERMDLSHYFGPVKDQGQLGSCTAFPIAAVYEFAANQNKQQVSVSELFIYYNSREIRGTIDLDSGASLLEAVNSVREKGACLSESHPYTIANFNQIPSKNSYTEGKHQVVEKAFRVQVNEKDFKQAVSNGHPVIFGLKLFQSFYPKNKSGLVPYPNSKEDNHKNHGHHAMLLVGYNDDEKLFKVRNSWGVEFGEKGYCYIPYDYLANEDFCTDAFVITEIVDLSFSEFEYDSKASFSFLKDALIRKKHITEFRLRERITNLSLIKKEYDIVVLQNDENTEKIKDSIFRKNLLRSIESAVPELIVQEAPVIASKPKVKLNRWIYFIVGGIVALFFSVFLVPLITIIGGILLGGIGLAIIIFAITKIIKARSGYKKMKLDNQIIPVPVENISAQDKYAFRVADRLFERFDEMDEDLITRYHALSKYYNKVKKWKEENIERMKNVDFKSPIFVFNVVEKKPLMDFLTKERDFFLERLPHLSVLFHEKYEPEEDNVEEVFNELKHNYLKDIQSNTDSVLDVSISEYLLGKRYPYFNEAPKLDEIIPKLERVSKPFCNLKSSFTDLKTQHYVLMEKITSHRTKKYEKFSSCQQADITPVKVERKDNQKKYVSIQVASVESIENLVRYTKNS